VSKSTPRLHRRIMLTVPPFQITIAVTFGPLQPPLIYISQLRLETFLVVHILGTVCPQTCSSKYLQPDLNIRNLNRKTIKVGSASPASKNNVYALVKQLANTCYKYPTISFYSSFQGNGLPSLPCDERTCQQQGATAKLQNLLQLPPLLEAQLPIAPSDWSPVGPMSAAPFPNLSSCC
jgi:hypothetical protein